MSRRAIVLTALFLALGATISAQGRKLNDPLAHRYGGRTDHYLVTPGGRLVYEAFDGPAGILSTPLDDSAPAATLFAIGNGRDLLGSTPDGSRILFRGGQASDHEAELYSAPADGSEPARRLHRAFVEGEDVYSYVVSPDGSQVVYQAVAGELNGLGNLVFRRRLFAVPPDGSRDPILLTPNVEAEVGYPGYAITPDSGRVVFLGRSRFNNALFSVSIDGSSGVVQLSPTTGAGRFELSSDGSRVVYSLGHFDSTQNQFITELYSSPVDGSTPAQRLNPPLPAGVQAGEFRVSPDSTRVFYVSGQVTNNFNGLYSVPLGGGTPQELVPLGVRFYEPLRITPDGSRVCYRNSAYSILSVPFDGSLPPVELSTGLGSTGEYVIAPDSQKLVFTAAQTVYSVPLDGSSAPVALLPAATDQSVTSIRILPGSDRALFRVLTRLNNTHDAYGQLYSARLDGTARVRLDATPFFRPTVINPRGVLSFLFDPQSDQVFYQADEVEPFVSEIYSAPVDGSVPGLVRSERTLEVTGQVDSFLVAPNGEHVTYFADLEAGFGASPFAGRGSYGVPLVGPAQSFRLTGMGSITPDSSHVIFPLDIVDVSYMTHRGLGSTLLAPSGNGVDLDPPFQGTVGDVADERVTLDSSHVVYRHVLPGPTENLYSVPIDGSQQPTELTGWSGGRVESFEIHRDSQHVVFLGRQPGSADRLWLATIGSPTPPVALTPVPIPGGNVSTFALSANGGRLVYLADQETDEVFELYSKAPNEPVKKLSAPMVPGGDVTSFRLQSDSARAVFLADADVNGVFELFSVPLDGSSAPTKIVPRGSQGSVENYQISSDSTHVVLAADLETPGVIELFAASTAGGSPPWKLSVFPVPGGDVDSFQIAPDGTRVVYVADQDEDETFELYSAPILGGAIPVRIGLPLRSGRDVSTSVPFQIDPASRWVLYNADVNVDEVFELYAARIDRPLPALRVNGRLLSATPTVVRGQFTAHGVVYLADEETPGKPELYLHALRAPRTLKVR